VKLTGRKKNVVWIGFEEYAGPVWARKDVDIQIVPGFITPADAESRFDSKDILRRISPLLAGGSTSLQGNRLTRRGTKHNCHH